MADPESCSIIIDGTSRYAAKSAESDSESQGQPWSVGDRRYHGGRIGRSGSHLLPPTCPETESGHLQTATGQTRFHSKTGWRQLGIPRILDRLVQQAIYHVLMPVLDGQFSAHSYGFRPHRSAQMAIRQSEQYWNEGYRVAVSCDLKSYFDTINHQRLMAYLERFVSDQMLLKLIWRFLHAGLMENEHVLATEQGTPQGGNLSPLLANLYLDQLDKELERRGHRFVRYADDFRIYVKSRRAG